MIVTLKEEEMETILREYITKKYMPEQNCQVRAEFGVYDGDDNEPAGYNTITFSVEFLKGSPE
jgi:hypothetical protein